MEEAREETITEKQQEIEDCNQYCFCNKPSNDDMIACDNENCKIKWYHYACVGVDPNKLPDSWYCPSCTSLSKQQYRVCFTHTIQTIPCSMKRVSKNSVYAFPR